MYYDINYVTGIITIQESQTILNRVRYLDTDKSSSGDGTTLVNAYHTMAALIAAEDDYPDLVARNERLIIRIYGDTKITAAITLAATWITDSDHYIHFIGMENTLIEITN